MSSCVSGCTIRGMHAPDCDGTTTDPSGQLVECRGCLPRPAEDGRCLCPWCVGRLTATVAGLPGLVDHLLLMAEPSVSSPSGHTDAGSSGSRPGEGMLYPSALVAVDDLHAVVATWAGEVAAERGIVSPPSGLSRWTVPDADGEAEPIGPAEPGSTAALVEWLAPHLEWITAQPWAGDMLADLATATARALARWPMAEPDRRVTDVRCPHCGCLSLVVSPPATAGASTTVRCSLPACGRVLGEEDWQHTRATALARAQATTAGAAS
ncbi:hypothetical protein [Actinomyces ruminis]|uniref:Uncharacterized protein n=1 Tax=Actinomyces ruminis TaxID=1937003 RepID=A0ABX4MEP8_9ACTO|nr:hypothetical protein [Actinomyces ruminis]PHP52582.1 hypothetical protein BW737_008850 [Actinomyces ruminis]